MASTLELRQALDVGGAAREALRASWGDWADEFCDSLVLRLIQPATDCKIHLWKSRDGTFQVNIDKNKTGAYTNDISSDPLATIGERLAP